MNIGSGSNIPQKLVLFQNYPNPFNPGTRIFYGLPEETPVRITIYNLAGQKIREVLNQNKTQGYHFVEWDGRNQDGLPVSSGIYIYVIKSNKEYLAKKMILMK